MSSICTICRSEKKLVKLADNLICLDCVKSQTDKVVATENKVQPKINNLQSRVRFIIPIFNKNIPNWSRWVSSTGIHWCKVKTLGCLVYIPYNMINDKLHIQENFSFIGYGHIKQWTFRDASNKEITYQSITISIFNKFADKV